MAVVRALGWFTGTYGLPVSDSSSITPSDIPRNGYRALATEGSSYAQVQQAALMPFGEYIDFMWRVKRWQFEYQGTLSASPVVAYKQTFATGIRTEGDLLGAPANYEFVSSGSGIIYSGAYSIGFVQGFAYERTINTPLGPIVSQSIGAAAWSYEDVYREKYFWNTGINDESSLDYTRLLYFPRWFVQSFAAPTRIVRTGYLTWQFDFDRNVDDSTNAQATVFSVVMSPAEWWTYGGRYSAANGAEL